MASAQVSKSVAPPSGDRRGSLSGIGALRLAAPYSASSAEPGSTLTTVPRG